MGRYSLTCWVCETPFPIGRYDDAPCPKCGTRYEYEEGHRIGAAEVRRLIAEAVATEREACAVEALGATHEHGADDAHQALRMAAAAIRARGKSR